MDSLNFIFGINAVQPSTVISFVGLAFIRGTFGIVVHYGIVSYKTPGLLFLLRTPGPIIMFLISVLYLASKNEESKLEILNNLKSPRTYKRAALLGFFQLCGPYMLFMYSMKFLSPTVGAVFMASTSWTTALLEKFLIPQAPANAGKRSKLIGSCVGVTGVVIVSITNLCLVITDTTCQAMYKNVTKNIISNGSLNVTIEKVLIHADTCATSLEIVTAYLALCGALLLWSISAVFSRLKHISIHFLVGGLLNNGFGGLYGGLLWVIVEIHINTDKVAWSSFGGSASVLFLSFASGWIASILLYYLYRSIGAESTNKVMCFVPLITWLEDLLLLHHYRHVITWFEVLGLVLVIIGLHMSSLKQQQNIPIGPNAPLLPGSESEEDDEETLGEPNELTNTVQSEGLTESGTSNMQESVEPPLLHYVDNEEEDGEEVW